MTHAFSSRPNVIYRVLHALLGVVGRILFNVRISGTENLPRRDASRRGWICAAVPHRNWVEPFVLFWALPARPRLVAVADGPAVTRSPLRRLLIHLAGGVVAVWPRAARREFSDHLADAERVIDAGAVLLILPEKGPPARPPELRRLSPSAAHFARHTGAAVVPVVLGGTHELYLRRPIELRILRPISPPPPSANATVIARYMAEFRSQAQAAAADAHTRAEGHAPRRKRWSWLTGNYPKAE